MFLPRFCLCVRLRGSPPNWTGQPRLRQFLAPWSGPVARLTRSVCKCDTEGSEQFLLHFIFIIFSDNMENTAEAQAPRSRYYEG